MEDKVADGNGSTQAVLGSYAQLGFVLGIPDDHVIVLLHESDRIALFSQMGATPESIRNECSKHLLVNHSNAVYSADQTAVPSDA